MLAIPHHSSHHNRLMLAVAASAHASAATRLGVATLSPGLQTPPACPERSRRVAGDARLDRVPVAEHRVESCNIPVSVLIFQSPQPHEQPRVAPSRCWAAAGIILSLYPTHNFLSVSDSPLMRFILLLSSHLLVESV